MPFFLVKTAFFYKSQNKFIEKQLFTKVLLYIMIHDDFVTQYPPFAQFLCLVKSFYAFIYCLAHYTLAYEIIWLR